MHDPVTNKGILFGTEKRAKFFFESAMIGGEAKKLNIRDGLAARLI